MREHPEQYEQQRQRMLRDARREAANTQAALDAVIADLNTDTVSTVHTRRLSAAVAFLNESVAWLAAMDATADLYTAFGRATLPATDTNGDVR
ncbi:hypothetical protein [Actinomadura rudentiformis]|uniref:Uncharacterized protein n=1 Tax=Actinomadura rudentiformis TaxID=359158 RepID=A0A6H9YUG6_9ACTN|nr:hypothetical protein [Actinomadura rudentiformis]KAB2347296.1 hypothetical protein F8566_19990 [Actinomadura rudentiformis]